MQAKYVLSNKVTERQFEKIVYQWLSEGDYTPDDIIENIVTENNQVLVPLYYVKGDYTGHCVVSLGYNHQEYYTTWDEVAKKKVTRSRTVTRWHPHSQQVQGNAYAVSYAGSAINEDIVNFVESMGWRGEDLQQIPMGSPRFQQVGELFKVNPTDSWHNKGSKKIYNEAQKQTISKLPSPMYRHLNLEINFQESLSFGIAAPYWLFTYEYNQQPYYVVVDGHSPDRIIGRKPEDKKRKAAVRNIYLFGWFTGLSGIATALYIFNYLNPSDDDPTLTNIGISVIGLIITAILVTYEVTKIKNKSKKEREEKLAKKLNDDALQYEQKVD